MPENTPVRLTLPKSCRLHHRSLVESLFADGKGVYDYPLRIVYRPIRTEGLNATFRDHVPDRIGLLQLLITVPKKKRRHAVDRVLMRRRIREAFRLHRAPLQLRLEEASDIRTLSMAVIYQSCDNIPYEKIEKSMRRLLDKIGRRLIQEEPRKKEEPCS